MSRIGRQPIKVPSGVTVTLGPKAVTVIGPKGSLTHHLVSGINVAQEGDQLVLSRISEEAVNKSNHGLMRSILNNMVFGVSQGYSKKLEVNGVGFRVNLAGQELKLALGYSHEKTYKLPEGIEANVDQNIITISGFDKQKVGQVAAEIRSLRKPEPYKGKGIKYQGERILRKSGKSGKEKA